MSKTMGKKLVKIRGSRRDTVEAMSICKSKCVAWGNCTTCSGGGSWSASEGPVKNEETFININL